MRSRERKADAILTADWHLRDDVPLCRTDDYWSAQARKVKFVNDLQVKYQCPVLLAGDLFDKARPSFFLVRWARINLPNRLMLVPGQHDLPNHSMKLLRDSGLGELITGNEEVCIAPTSGSPEQGFFVWGFPYGAQLAPNKYAEKGLVFVALAHALTSPHAAGPWAKPVESVLNSLAGFNLVVCGDNHETFTYRNKRGQLLVSPGSLMRMDADQAEHRPCVFLWHTDENTVEPVYLPIEEDIVDRSHIEEEKARDTRMEAYRSKLKAGAKVGVSFEKNMERFLAENKVKDGVKSLVHLAMEEER